MDTVLLPNANLFVDGFTKSFTELSKIKQLPAATKYDIVKLRKEMIDVHNTLKETLDGMDKDGFKELMKIETEYDFKKIDNKLVVNSLSAEDLFNLEPLLKE